MGVDIIVLYVALAVASLFATNKAVDVYKHSETLDADRYSTCVQATKDARQCRGLE
jgi:hypothetical protein